jgi:hypothetical protein
MAFNAGFEWSIAPPPEGLVSVVVRMTLAEANAAAGLLGPAAQAAAKVTAGEALASAMEAAVAAGDYPAPGADGP